MRKSGEMSSRPKRSGEDCDRRNGATSYRAHRKIDSTRASAMRLLASRRSIPPPWPRNPRQTRAVVIVSFDLRVSRPQIHGSLPANPGGCMTGAGDRMSRRQCLAAGAALAGYALAAAPSLAKAVRTDEAGLATAQAEIHGQRRRDARRRGAAGGRRQGADRRPRSDSSTWCGWATRTWRWSFIPTRATRSTPTTARRTSRRRPRPPGSSACSSSRATCAPQEEASMLTRRGVVATGTVVTGYALSVETVLAQAIKTDTTGLVAGDYKIPVAGFDVPVYEARPAGGSNHP